MKDLKLHLDWEIEYDIKNALKAINRLPNIIPEAIRSRPRTTKDGFPVAFGGGYKVFCQDMTHIVLINELGELVKFKHEDVLMCV